MKIYLGTDHAGYELKNIIKEFLERDLGCEVIDKGAFEFDKDDDYPDYIVPVAQSIAEDQESMGIIFGGSGQGEAIAANRTKGVRAAVYYGGPTKIVTLSREHNNANILSIGARFVTENEAKEVVRLWLETAFSDKERYMRRIKKVDA